MSYKTKYVPGTHHIICDICGFQIRSNEAKVNWLNQLVCPEDYEAKHPQLEVPPEKRGEGHPPGKVQGEPSDVFRTINDVTESNNNF